MGVGDLQVFEHALDRAILAERPVQRVEGYVRREIRQHLADVTRDVDARHFVAFGFEGVGARLA